MTHLEPANIVLCRKKIMRHLWCRVKFRKKRPQAGVQTMLQILTFLTLVDMGRSAVIKYESARIPDCSHLKNDGKQFNAKVFHNGKKCCFCSMGTFLSEDCNDADPRSTVCLPCPYTEDHKSFVDYEPHVLEKCIVQKQCMPGKMEVGGSRSEESRCVCPDGTVEVDKHCEAKDLDVVLPIEKSTSTSTALTRAGEVTKHPGNDPGKQTTSSTVKHVPSLSTTEPVQSEMVTITTKQNPVTDLPPLSGSAIDIQQSTGSTIPTAPRNEESIKNYQNLLHVILIVVSIIAGLILIGILLLCYFLRRSKKKSNNEPAVSESRVGFVNNDTRSSSQSTLSGSTTEDRNSGEDGSLLSRAQEQSSSDVDPIPDVADSPQSVVADSDYPRHEEVVRVPIGHGEMVPQHPEDTTPDPVIVNHDQSVPTLALADKIVTETRTEKSVSTTVGKEATSLIEDSSIELVIEEQAQPSNKAGPIEQRAGPLVENTGIADNLNGPPNAEQAPRLLSGPEKEKRRKVLGKCADEINKRDLPRVGRSLLPYEEYDYIDEMIEKYQNHKSEAAHKIFQRVQEVNSNMTLQEIYTKVEKLGYLGDIVREGM